MQVAYITRKVFADGSEEIRIKHNQEITRETIKSAKKTRTYNKIQRNIRKRKLINDIYNLNLFDPDYAYKARILNYELRLRDIKNVSRSAYRSRQALYDICRCNDFLYFVTWTFNKVKVDRLNDEKVKRKFTQFQNYLRKKFPHMYYVAVPEYHKDGGLHFHLLIGGITMDELKAIPARYEKRKGRHKKGDLIFKNGKQIFNVERWKLGYSTLSIIENAEASKHYICKYISKQHYDERFFGKRRYYVSMNIKRPEIIKDVKRIEHCLDGIDLNVYTVAYGDLSKKYAVLIHDGNGIVDYTRNTAEVKRHMKQLCTPTESAYGCERLARRTSALDGAGACAYLTLRTLDRKNENIASCLSYSPLWLFALNGIYKDKKITDEQYLQEIGLID